MTDRATRDPERIGTFNYLAHSVRTSLHRNGAVRIRRDRDGSDSEVVGLAIEKRDVPVHDARQLAGEARRTLACNGFELLPWSGGIADLEFEWRLWVVPTAATAAAALSAGCGILASWHALRAPPRESLRG